MTVGIYFDYDFEGKEVERYLPCYLCNEKKVVFVEYHVPSGSDGYVLYDDARKLFSGSELLIGSLNHLVCEDCLKEHGNEENVVAEILKRRTEASKEAKKSEVKYLEEDIEETRRHLDELNEKLTQLYRLRDEALKE